MERLGEEIRDLARSANQKRSASGKGVQRMVRGWGVLAGGRLLPELYLSQRHWLFGSDRPIETQDIPGLLANPKFDNSQSGGHMVVGSFLDHD